MLPMDYWNESPRWAACSTMSIFKSDLFRAFAIGFAVGTLALCVIFGGNELAAMAGNVVPSAVAAPAR